MHTLALARPPRGLTLLAAVVTALSLAACGGGGSDPATPALTGAISPSSGPLGTTQTIRVTFSASMNTTSQVLGGTLAGANMLAGWTRTTVANDTLVLTPALPWATDAQTVTVMASDATGRALATPLQASYTVAAAESCGPVAGVGACNNLTDCGFTVAQLADWTQACFIGSNFDAPATSSCVQQEGVTAGCADCTTAMAGCGIEHCLTACVAGGFSSPDCVACVADNCATSFLACAGRTL
jgi:hypothetical protein